jgi:hypothetical protein
MTVLSEDESGAGASFVADLSALPAEDREQTETLKRVTAKRAGRPARDFMAGRILSETSETSCNTS